MAFDNSFNAVTGQTYTASQYNTYTKGNLTALWVYTTAGDLAYATSSTALARLAKPSFNGLLKMTSGGVPSYVNFKTAIYTNATGSSYSSTTERDLPNSSSTITLDVVSTLLVFGIVQVSNGAGNCWSQFALSVDGTTQAFKNFNYGNGDGVTVALHGMKTGVTAGAKTIKIREKEGYGAAVSYTVSSLEWLVIAVPE